MTFSLHFFRGRMWYGTFFFIRNPRWPPFGALLHRLYELFAFFHLFQILVHPHFQRRNEEAVLVFGHVLYVRFPNDKDFDPERVPFDLYLFQFNHLLFAEFVCLLLDLLCHIVSLLFDIFSRRYSKSFLFFRRIYSTEKLRSSAADSCVSPLTYNL